MTKPLFILATIICQFIGITSVEAADMGAASAYMMTRPNNSLTSLDGSQVIQRVRIPVILQGWNSLASSPNQGGKQAKIPAKPLNHVLRARLEKPNDFYLGDWRIQTSPIRWLKSSNQYQVKLEIYRRLGEAGQVEESLGSLNLSGILQKQSEGVYGIQGSSKRKFLDAQGQPVLEIEVGSPTPANEPTMISKAGVNSENRPE